MRVQNPFFDIPVTETKTGTLSGAVGIVLRGQRMPVAAYETGLRIKDAGSTGVPVEIDGSRSHVNLLRDAGVEVRTDAIGSKWFIDRLPDPDLYLVRK